jgi:hypothetical protein
MTSALVLERQQEQPQRSCYGRRRSEPCSIRGYLSERQAEEQLSLPLGEEDSMTYSPTQAPEEDSVSDLDQGDGVDEEEEDGGQFCNTLTDESLTYTHHRPAATSDGSSTSTDNSSAFLYAMQPTPHQMQHSSFAVVASPNFVPMVQPYPADAFSSASFNVSKIDSGLHGSAQYMMPLGFPMMMMQQKMSADAQLAQPANMIDTMPTLLGRRCTASKRMAPYTTPLDCVTPTLDREVSLTSAADVEVRTSLLLRNLPDSFMRREVMDVLRTKGLAPKVDFLYTPGNLKIMRNCGYAFVNFATPEAAMECLEKLHGFHWDAEAEHICEVSWCNDHQGLDAHVERYRNSRIMHESVADEYKPALFSNGFRIPFPLPSKVLQRPRLRKA